MTLHKVEPLFVFQTGSGTIIYSRWCLNNSQRKCWMQRQEVAYSAHHLLIVRTSPAYPDGNFAIAKFLLKLL